MRITKKTLTALLKSTPAAHIAVGLFGLLLLGAALLTLPQRFMPASPSPDAVPLSPRPSPTWRSMPTRSPALPTARPPIDLLSLHQALLQGDLEKAGRLWRAINPEDLVDQEVYGELLQAGARLALLQDQPQIAEDRAWKAAITAPEDPQAWSLLGFILRQNQKHRLADEVLAYAESLDPTLTAILFRDRWQLALAAGDSRQLLALAADYQTRYPDSVWLPYYSAEALIAAGAAQEAVTLLVSALGDAPDSPALHWYTLGRAYLARGAYAEATVALETAAIRVGQGDTSLERVTPDAIRALTIALGQSYLGSRQCQDAEAMLRRVTALPENGEPAQPATQPWSMSAQPSADTRDAEPDLPVLLEAAIRCQTPTPTLTPWIPKQFGIATPRP